MNLPARQISSEAFRAAGRRVVVIINDRDYFLRHRQPVVKRLVALGADVTVITGGRPAEPGEDAGWKSVHMPVDRHSITPFRDILFFLRSFGHIARIRPQVLHLMTLKPVVFSGPAALLSRLIGRGPERILITVPGLGRLMSPGGTGAGRLSPAARGLAGRVIRLLSSRRDVRFSFETASDRNLWLADGLIRDDNSTVINGAGCDPKEFYPDPKREPRDKVRILFASRLLRSKGLDVFVDMARRLANRPDVEFVVAGISDPNDPDDYPADALRQEQSLSFLGEIHDMPVLLRGVDLVCLPTLYGEGVPRILIEAAACGVACLATDLDGCREIVENDVTGILVPDFEPRQFTDAFTAAATSYLDDPEKLRRHGKAGLERFRSRGFSEEAVVAHFIELLLAD